MPKRVESLGEAVERRVHLHARPQKIDNLLPVQRMLRARGQQLREHLSAPPLPLGDGSGRVTALYPKAAEQAHVEDGGPLSPVAGRSQRAHLRHLNPPPVLAQDALGAMSRASRRRSRTGCPKAVQSARPESNSPQTSRLIPAKTY